MSLSHFSWKHFPDLQTSKQNVSSCHWLQVGVETLKVSRWLLHSLSLEEFPRASGWEAASLPAASPSWNGGRCWALYSTNLWSGDSARPDDARQGGFLPGLPLHGRRRAARTGPGHVMGETEAGPAGLFRRPSCCFCVLPHTEARAGSTDR